MIFRNCDTYGFLAHHTALEHDGLDLHCSADPRKRRIEIAARRKLVLALRDIETLTATKESEVVA